MSGELLLKELDKNNKAYDDNFMMLEVTAGTPAHHKYITEERRLNRKDIDLRKRLGIFLPDPCPINGGGKCVDCTGYYKKDKRYFNSKGSFISKNYQCGKTESAFECKLKNIR